MYFVNHLLEIKQCVKAPWVNGVENPSTTGAEAVAAAGRRKYLEKIRQIVNIYRVYYLTGFGSLKENVFLPCSPFSLGLWSRRS